MTRLMLAAVLCAALAGSWAYAQFGDKPAPLETIRLHDDLFVIHNVYVPGNTTGLVTSGGPSWWTTSFRSTTTVAKAD